MATTTAADKKLGTFLGVYTPTILTILGVIMYLRFGWLVGHLGLARVLVVVLLANVITLVTTLSFSSVATNARVGAGGAYFIISRSLGIEIGGSIGYPLFLSQAFSVTLYAYGLAESLRFVWPELHVPLATVIILVAVGVLAVLGAEAALRAQIPLMGLVALSLRAYNWASFRSAPAFWRRTASISCSIRTAWLSSDTTRSCLCIRPLPTWSAEVTPPCRSQP